LLDALDVDVDLVVRALPGARDADLGGELSGAVETGRRKLGAR
jgi:hypothetical protein